MASASVRREPLPFVTQTRFADGVVHESPFAPGGGRSPVFTEADGL